MISAIWKKGSYILFNFPGEQLQKAKAEKAILKGRYKIFFCKAIIAIFKISESDESCIQAKLIYNFSDLRFVYWVHHDH